jgi:hypothetical protein
MVKRQAFGGKNDVVPVAVRDQERRRVASARVVY